MKHPLCLVLVAMSSLGSIAVAGPATNPAGKPATLPIVDPGAVKDKRAYDRKKGMVIEPATVRMIVPGMNKDAVYRLVRLRM